MRNNVEIISIQNIDRFWNCKTIAVAGASRKEKSFSTSAIKHLRTKGYEILSINPNFPETSVERKEFKSLDEILTPVKNILVITSPNQTHSVVKKALEKGFDNIWIQQKSETPEVIALCRNQKINLIYNHCIFMFTQPEGIHKFHFNIKKLFGTIPR
jgi:predicted CoA-binding protein